MLLLASPHKFLIQTPPIQNQPSNVVLSNYAPHTPSLKIGDKTLIWDSVKIPFEPSLIVASRMTGSKSFLQGRMDQSASWWWRSSQICRSHFHAQLRSTTPISPGLSFHLHQRCRLDLMTGSFAVLCSAVTSDRLRLGAGERDHFRSSVDQSDTRRTSLSNLWSIN